jgi:hypothetical protein
MTHAVFRFFLLSDFSGVGRSPARIRLLGSDFRRAAELS